MVQGPATIIFAFFRGFPPLKQLPNDGSSRSGYDEEIPFLRFDKVSIRQRFAAGNHGCPGRNRNGAILLPR